MKNCLAYAIATVLLYSAVGGAFGEEVPDATSNLRSAIMSANVGYAAEIMTEEQDVYKLAEGMKPAPGSPPFAPSKDRRNDPDVVVFKAIVTAILESDIDPAMVKKLAEAMILSVKPPGGYPKGVNSDTLMKDMEQKLSNYDTLVEIRDSDPNQDKSENIPPMG